MIEARINPPDDLELRAECPCCREVFVFWHPFYNPEVYYSFWDEDGKEPLCSEECRKEYEEEYGWEYQEQAND